MKLKQKSTVRKERRIKRVRNRIFGTSDRPRLCIFLSNRSIYAQLINDAEGKTLDSASSKELKGIKDSGKNVKEAEIIGELLAKKAKEKDISMAVFDRRGYKYHGRVKAIAEGARKGGLNF